MLEIWTRILDFLFSFYFLPADFKVYAKSEVMKKKSSKVVTLKTEEINDSNKDIFYWFLIQILKDQINRNSKLFAGEWKTVDVRKWIKFWLTDLFSVLSVLSFFNIKYWSPTTWAVQFFFSFCYHLKSDICYILFFIFSVPESTALFTREWNITSKCNRLEALSSIKVIKSGKDPKPWSCLPLLDWSKYTSSFPPVFYNLYTQFLQIFLLESSSSSLGADLAMWD